MMKKTLLILGGLWLTFLLGAESLLTLDLKMLQAAGYDETENTWAYGGTGTADLVMKSTGNKNVKGELSLTYIPIDGLPAGTSYVSLEKASIKVQFPSLRLTMGKTRIGWGEGYVFNSGDVLYGSLSPTVDLTADEARSDTALLTLARVSLGRSYMEGIVMAAEADFSDLDPETGAPGAPEIWETSAGGRLVTEILGATVEGGYLCKGQEKAAGDEKGHRPYLSIHGYGWLDWYGSGSLALPFSHPLWEDNVRETVNFSTGLFRQFGLGYDGSLGVRLEALLFPWQEWNEQAGGLEEESYALYLYPELTFGIGQNLTLPLMAIVSPVDLSAQITAGASWQVYQGFSFLGYVIAEAGDGTDTFESGNVSLMAGMRYKY